MINNALDTRILRQPREKTDNSKIHRTVCCFQEGYNCAQALLVTYGEQFGIDREVALRLAAVFGSGMGMAEICGAVTGAYMVIGAKYGESKAGEHQSSDRARGAADDFTNEFKSRNKSIVCRELLGHDICTPDGLKLIQEKGLLKVLCPKFVQDAAEIIEHIL
jgi:C_GCAxxG_C_C family probable redox protein